MMRLAAVALAAFVAACATLPAAPIPTVPDVDLARFMGDWYVIAHIPAPLEGAATNAVESYQLRPDGTVATTYRFHDGSPHGPERSYHPTGIVVDPVNHSIWQMRFLWRLGADYRIAALDADYRETIIARNRRDYVWIMARTPVIDEARYARLVAAVAALGYDTSRLRRVPQRW